MSQDQIAIFSVLLVFIISFVSNYFSTSYNVQYSEWFIDMAHQLCDTAEMKAARGTQDMDQIVAIQDYTTALTIVDTLHKVVPSNEEISKMCNFDIDKFTTMVNKKRNEVLAAIETSRKKNTFQARQKDFRR